MACAAKTCYECDVYTCSGGSRGNREIGFWFEPFDGQSRDVCHRYVKNNIDYDATGSDRDDREVRAKWSQVEIIYYAAKWYKDTWAP